MTPERRAAETALTDRLADTIRKRAERQRRREAGEVRVEVWLSAEEAAWVRQRAADSSLSAAEIVRWCVCTVMADRD